MRAIRRGFANLVRARCLLAFAGVGCAHAWPGGRPVTFDLAVPEGWTVTRNYRWFGNEFLTMSHEDAAIGVEILRETADTRRAPLDLLSETRALTWGRGLDVVNVATHADHIDLDGHEAWAVTGHRRWHDSAMVFSTVMMRTRTHAIILSLMAPSASFQTAVPAWSGVLSTFHLPHDRIPDDAPLYPSERDEPMR